MMGYCSYPGCRNTEEGCFRPNCKFVPSNGMSKPAKVPVITLDALIKKGEEILKNYDIAVEDELHSLLDYFKQAAGRE